jgi:fructose/tagatose bisphosphate aldolase
VQEINKYGGKLGEDTAGVPEADIEIARRVGCTKVNIDTDLRLAMTAAIRKCLLRTQRNSIRASTSAPPDARQGTGPPQSARRPLLRRPRL